MGFLKHLILKVQSMSGFKDEIDNQDWIIARAEHVIDDSGFTTRLELEAKIPDWIAETE